jgi:hypothetical protein
MWRAGSKPRMHPLDAWIADRPFSRTGSMWRHTWRMAIMLVALAPAAGAGCARWPGNLAAGSRLARAAAVVPDDQGFVVEHHLRIQAKVGEGGQVPRAIPCGQVDGSGSFPNPVLVLDSWIPVSLCVTHLAFVPELAGSHWFVRVYGDPIATPEDVERFLGRREWWATSRVGGSAERIRRDPTPAATKLTMWVAADDGSHHILGFDLEFLIVPREQGGTYLLASVAFQPGQVDITTIRRRGTLPNEPFQADIDAYGCHVIHVLEDDEGPPFSYSVGVQKTSGSPEVIVPSASEWFRERQPILSRGATPVAIN